MSLIKDSEGTIQVETYKTFINALLAHNANINENALCGIEDDVMTPLQFPTSKANVHLTKALLECVANAHVPCAMDDKSFDRNQVITSFFEFVLRHRKIKTVLQSYRNRYPRYYQRSVALHGIR